MRSLSLRSGNSPTTPYGGRVNGLQILGFPPPCSTKLQGSGSYPGGYIPRSLLDAQGGSPGCHTLRDSPSASSCSPRSSTRRRPGTIAGRPCRRSASHVAAGCCPAFWEHHAGYFRRSFEPGVGFAPYRYLSVSGSLAAGAAAGPGACKSLSANDFQLLSWISRTAFIRSVLLGDDEELHLPLSHIFTSAWL